MTSNSICLEEGTIEKRKKDAVIVPVGMMTASIHHI